MNVFRALLAKPWCFECWLRPAKDVAARRSTGSVAGVAPRGSDSGRAPTSSSRSSCRSPIRIPCVVNITVFTVEFAVRSCGRTAGRYHAHMTKPSNDRNEELVASPQPATLSRLRTLRVCSWESRKQDEMRSLIERNNGDATIAASLREVPLSNNVAVFEFLNQLLADKIDGVIFMTGVGARALLDVVETQVARAVFWEALQKCCLIVRGPKPTAVLREWGCRIDHRAPEPNTWRELLSVIDAGVRFPGSTSPSEIRDRTFAIQEYGLPSQELYDALGARGATVRPVPVYRWELPEDIAPLESAIRATIVDQFDVMLFTSAQQIRNVLDVSERLGMREAFLAAANRLFVGSIGPTCSDALRESGLRVDLEPSHPHMGHLVRESLERVNADQATN